MGVKQGEPLLFLFFIDDVVNNLYIDECDCANMNG